MEENKYDRHEDMTHNGYTGSCEYSHIDGVFFGKLLHIPDLVTYESETRVGLGNEFRLAILDYIDDLESLNLR